MVEPSSCIRAAPGATTARSSVPRGCEAAPILKVTHDCKLRAIQGAVEVVSDPTTATPAISGCPQLGAHLRPYQDVPCHSAACDWHMPSVINTCVFAAKLLKSNLMKLPSDEDAIESVLFFEEATVVQFISDAKEPASRKRASSLDCSDMPRIRELPKAAGSWFSEPLSLKTCWIRDLNLEIYETKGRQ